MHKPKKKSDEAYALAPELERIKREVGDEHYAKATARLFARGARFGPGRPRRRYALT